MIQGSLVSDFEISSVMVSQLTQKWGIAFDSQQKQDSEFRFT